jgi:Tfp pilus assembly protein PilO
MKALFSTGASVPLAQVIQDYRRWLWPLVALVGLNVAVLVLVVVPRTRTVGQAEERSAAAAQALARAAHDFKAAEALRDGQTQSAADLAKFYEQVLPIDVAAARRVTQLQLSQLARRHNVTFQRSSATPEVVRGSSLERLHVTYSLFGNYDDIRQMIYDIETGTDFVIIDNVLLAEGQDMQAPLTLTLDVSTYYRTAGDVR